MKKIGFVLRTFSATGGAERTASMLMNALAEKYQVFAISYLFANSCAYPLDARIKVLSIFEKEKEHRERDLLQPQYFMRLREILKKLDVVIFVSTASTLGLIVTIGLKNLKKITWEQTSLSHIKDDVIQRRINQDIAFFLSDSFICLTKFDSDILEKKKFIRQKVSYVYNAMNETLLKNEEKCDIEKRQIVTLARLDPVKGLEYLLDVAKIVLSHHTDWEWKVYGQYEDEAYGRKIKAMVEASGVADRLHFLPPVKDVAKVLADSSIYVMTSRFEGLPMALLEAKAMKLPSVSFDCKTGPSEIIIDGVNGDLVPCYDIETMAEKIERLMDNPSLRQQYADHAWDNIDKFRMKHIKEQWIQLIEE